MAVVDFVYEARNNGANWANRVDKYLDGHGRVTGEIGFTAGFEMDVVASVYDQFGRMKTQSRPYRLNTSWGLVGTKEWTNYNYDILDRVSSVVAPDGSTTNRYYNQKYYTPSANAAYPSAASSATAKGNTILVVDAWGRERWARSDEQNRLAEVVEPDPAGNGAVASNGLLTTYSYNTLGNLTDVNQGGQTRQFKYDSLGRLTNQHLAEREKTLDANGGNGSSWSDYFKYDSRGNLIERIDARRVKTTFNYNNDPLNRLYQVSYDKAGAINEGDIVAASTVTYKYLTTGDKTRLDNVELGTPNNAINAFGEQSFTYDSEGRVSSALQHYGSSRTATTSYEFDTLDRTSKIYYPAQNGQSGNPVRQAVPTYDEASRLKKLTYNGTTMAEYPVYNASSQTTQLNIGSATQEQYTFDPQTGLLTNQKVKQGSTTHVDLTYEYGNLYAGGNATWKTGQLSRIIDHKGSSGNRNREYHYDKLGRLAQAKGGLNGGQWNQTYSYDRYGNRTSVSKSGTSAGGGTIDDDGLSSVGYNTATNRITNTNFAYDAAGNQTQSNENGQINNYKYDAAGRLAEVTVGTNTHTYAYGASNQRLQMVEVGGSHTLYAWAGGSVIAEYNGVGSGMAWTKSYVYLGGRLLATDSTSGIQYHHPDRLGTRLVTNTSGGIVSENIGLPFGNTISGESSNLAGSDSKKRFTSYDRSDTTKLDYAVNRHYSAAQGRFTQVDPIGMSAVSSEDPQSLNLYSYCGNDPINRTDPGGLFSFKKLFGGIRKVFMWIAIAAAIAITIITVTPIVAFGALKGAIIVWAGNHTILAALSGLVLPNLIFSLAAAGAIGAAATTAAFWAMAAVGAVSTAAGKKQAKKGKKKKTIPVPVPIPPSATSSRSSLPPGIINDGGHSVSSICSDLRELLDRERLTNTKAASVASKFVLSVSSLTNIVYVTFSVEGRQLDLDWMIHLHSVRLPTGLGIEQTYETLKRGWNLYRKYAKADYAEPWADIGEVTAVQWAGAGRKYSELFNEPWMKANCPGK